MNWRFKIGRLLGIDLYVHWAFLGLLLLVLVPNSLFGTSGSTLQAGVHRVLFVLALFVCVVLHEYGHALTARAMGIRTRDIVILPFGGVARLERGRYVAWQELLIAIAGPAVNVVIAIVLLIVILTVFGREVFASAKNIQDNFWAGLMLVNIGLVVFNAVPAFPMDGGRVLRSLLAMVLQYARATMIAARLGQAIAICFVAYGVYRSDFSLALVGAFVFMGASGEIASARQRLRAARVLVEEVIDETAITVTPEDSIGPLQAVVASGQQSDFPVLERGRVVGMVPGVAVLEETRAGRWTIACRQIMRVNVPVLKPTDSLERVIDLLGALGPAGLTNLPVERDGVFLGLISPAKIARAMSDGPSPAPAATA